MINFICILALLEVVFVKILFLFASKCSKNMFYWLDAMEYNEENQSLDKLNLKENESNKFVKRLSLSIFLLRCFTISAVIFYYLITPIFIYRSQNGYYLNYFISSLFFLPEIYYGCKSMFGIFRILYLYI